MADVNFNERRKVESYSIAKWPLIYEDYRFLFSDFKAVQDELELEASGTGSCFRFLSGSARKSPRFRDPREGNCVILRYLGDQRYLARTTRCRSATASNDPRHLHFHPQPPCQFLFIVIDDKQPRDRNTSVVFRWTLPCNGGRRAYDDTGYPVDFPVFEVGISTTCLTHNSHFESYSSCRKRFAIVVGPPHRKCDDRPEVVGTLRPSSCIFDGDDGTMKVMEGLRLTGSGRDDLWVAAAAFDPRPSREHVAAIVACSGAFPFLPRSEQTGSVVIFDVLRHVILNVVDDGPSYSSAYLTYTCNGKHLLATTSLPDDVGAVVTSSSTTSSLPITSSPAMSSSTTSLFTTSSSTTSSCMSSSTVGAAERENACLTLLSGDASHLPTRLPLSRLLIASPTSVVTSVVSSDEQTLALFSRRLAPADVEISTNPGISSLSSRLPTTDVEARPTKIVIVPLEPKPREPLVGLCMAVLRKCVLRRHIDSLPVPKLLRQRLKEAPLID